MAIICCVVPCLQFPRKYEVGTVVGTEAGTGWALGGHCELLGSVLWQACCVYTAIVDQSACLHQRLQGHGVVGREQQHASKHVNGKERRCALPSHQASANRLGETPRQDPKVHRLSAIACPPWPLAERQSNSRTFAEDRLCRSCSPFLAFAAAAVTLSMDVEHDAGQLMRSTVGGVN